MTPDAARTRRSAASALARARSRSDHPPAVLASSFGAEDMVLLDLIARDAPADRDLHARHRPPARGDARADRRARDRYGLADRRLLARCRGASSLRRASTASTRSTTASSCASVLRDPQDRAAAPRARRQAAPGSRACAASSRSRAATLPCEEFDAEHGLRQVQSAGRLDRGRRVGLHPRATTCPYNALHDRGYPQHRLRAVHARGRARRGRARRPLVVGEPRAQGMRAASATRRFQASRRRGS